VPPDFLDDITTEPPTERLISMNVSAPFVEEPTDPANPRSDTNPKTTHFISQDRESISLVKRPSVEVVHASDRAAPKGGGNALD